MSRGEILRMLDSDALGRYAAVLARRDRQRLTDDEVAEAVLDRLASPHSPDLRDAQARCSE